VKRRYRTINGIRYELVANADGIYEVNENIDIITLDGVAIDLSQYRAAGFHSRRAYRTAIIKCRLKGNKDYEKWIQSRKDAPNG